MQRRPGITLTEALVALFIAALGMISLLTLFPLGAMQMGQALKDSRTAQSAQDADGLLRWYWAKYETNPSAASPILTALDQGDGLAATAYISPADRGPSYPVFVDPQGASSSTTWPQVTQRNRLANLQTIPRRTVFQPVVASGTSLISYSPLLTSSGMIERFTVLQDELEYDPNLKGAPASSGGKILRGAQYSWSWMLQRPSNEKRGLVNMTAVVYFKRTPFFGNADSERTYGAGALPATPAITLTPNTTRVEIDYNGSVRPELVKGRWIMDATNADGSLPLRHAKFYRVVSVEADTTNKKLFIELETPIQRSDRSTAPYSGTIMIFNRVAEVFERPPLVTGDGQVN